MKAIIEQFLSEASKFLLDNSNYEGMDYIRKVCNTMAKGDEKKTMKAIIGIFPFINGSEKLHSTSFNNKENYKNEITNYYNEINKGK